MPARLSEIESQAPALQAFLLGQVEFERALALQQRLVAEAHRRGDGQISLLLCEHPPIITIGRGGSAGEIALENRLVRSRQVEVRWVNRGGGCLLHCPGQLAIYPLVPLRWHGLSVGEFLDRFHLGIVKTLDDLNVQLGGKGDRHVLFEALSRPPRQNAPVPFSVANRHGVLGRTGQLAALAVAVRHWITYYGGYLNVCPPMGLFRLVESDSHGQPPMSCLVAERCGPARMTAVRAALVRRLAECFGCDRYHLYTGHPLLHKAALGR
jgi:lipoyl(octanoyl) transferase